MYQFDSLTVAELKALCAELGVIVGNSAPKSEYVAGLEKYFQDENVGEALMGIKRDNLQKVARRFSIPASGTKREMTDAILAKVNSQPAPVVTPPVVVADPEPETRKGLPWWAWALIVAGLILIAVLAFRPRQAAPAVDLSPIQESIGQVSTKVDALGQSINDLAGRVIALESEPEAPAAPVEEPVVEEPQDIEVEADQTFVFNGSVPAYSDFRAAVREPGDTATFDLYFEVALKGATIPRIWPDDILLSATLLIPGKDPVDLTKLFEMIFVSKGGTGDTTLDKALQARGVNIAEGEILMQNKNIVSLGDVPAGTHIVFEIKDNESLAVNRGIGVVIDSNYADGFTVNLP